MSRLDLIFGIDRAVGLVFVIGLQFFDFYAFDFRCRLLLVELNVTISDESKARDGDPDATEHRHPLVKEREGEGDDQNDFEASSHSDVDGRSVLDEKNDGKIVREGQAAAKGDKNRKLVVTVGVKCFDDVLEVADCNCHWNEEDYRRQGCVQQHIQGVELDVLPSHEVARENELGGGSEDRRQANQHSEEVVVRRCRDSQGDAEGKGEEKEGVDHSVLLSLHKIRGKGGSHWSEGSNKLVEGECRVHQRDVVQADIHTEPERNEHKLGQS